MRCKNCGWDNPEGNVKCEKCNVSLSSYEIEAEMPRSGYDSDDFNPKATYVGCSACGYPVRPTDTECPVCGHVFSGSNVDKTGSGTVIQGVASDKEVVDKQRKRLVAFLVTYSNSPNGVFFPLFEGKNYIGRDHSSHVCLQDDSTISERHMSILFRPVDRKFKFKDEQSSNGSFVNGQLLDEGELKNFDEIRIGATRLLFMEIPQTFFE